MKKLTSVFLVLAMLFSMALVVSAENENVACVTDKSGNEIGTYQTLDDAISVATQNEESAIILMNDIVIESAQKIKSGKFTLDLNGQTISSEAAGGNGIIVDSDAELTVVDSGIIGEISTDNFAFMNDGTLIIKSGKFSSSYGIYSYGTVVVDGGNIQGSISNNGSLIVNGGTLSKIKNLNTSHVATVEINGGTFTDSDTIENSDGEITVKGGTYPNGFSVINDGILEFTINTVVADGYYIFGKDGDIAKIDDNATQINGYVKITNGVDITLSQERFVYSGNECRPEATVKLFEETLVENEDYILSYTNNKNAGTATVTATAVAGGLIKGETSKDFEIAPKPVTASATVADKVYDGTTTVDASAIEITFEGVVDGDDVVIEKCLGMFLSANVGNNKKIQIAYWVSGEDVNNYEIYEDYISFPEAEYYFIETKANILPKDISDAEIVLGDALTYNAEEQTQTIKSVTVDGLKVTYTVSENTATNVGVYELTVTGNGNFTGEAKIVFEIAPDVSAIENLTADNVKSDDKELIETVRESIENAETDLADDAKKSEYKGLIDKCDMLLEKISETNVKIEVIGALLEKLDEDKVTVFDKTNINSIIANINNLLENENVNEEEVKILNEYKAQAEKLLETVQNPAEYLSVRFLYLVKEAFNRLWEIVFKINFYV